jgi:hypothetical protein
MDTNERPSTTIRQSLADIARELDIIRQRIAAMSATARGDTATDLSTIHNNLIVIEKQILRMV